MMEILFLLFKKKRKRKELLVQFNLSALFNVLFEMVPEMRLKSTVFIFFYRF